MIDIDFIRNYPDLFDAGMKKRECSVRSVELLSLDKEKRDRLTKIQALQNQKNIIVKEISRIRSTGLDSSKEQEESKNIQGEIDVINKDIENNKDLVNILDQLPNIPCDSVPIGKGELDNIEIKKFGELREFDFQIKFHYELGINLGYMDFKDTSELCGSRFVTLKGKLAALERALMMFMLDIHTKEHEYEEINHPSLVRNEVLYGTGQLPKFDQDVFTLTNGMRLIPTSEVFLTNLVKDKILKESQLPMRFVAYSQCFRSEAGSARKDIKGMIRLHQFSKVELVSIVRPNDSVDELEKMLSSAEKVLQRLGLPYRIMQLCTADMGFSANHTYDIEVWMPAEDKYREISSCSNCGDFQARRMKAKYKDKSNQKKIFVHTLNGSGVAIGRVIAAILENYQNSDGSITIPDVLSSYMNGMKLID